MGQPAEKQRRATYADLEAVPSNKVAELVRGTLRNVPPAGAEARVDVVGPGSRADRPLPAWTRRPGWLDHPGRAGAALPRAGRAREIDALVPDLAGWRCERMPELPETAYFALAPDWICEVLSPSTKELDRDEKMPISAREGVRHAWLVDPIQADAGGLLARLGSGLGARRRPPRLRSRPRRALRGHRARSLGPLGEVTRRSLRARPPNHWIPYSLRRR